MSPAQPSAQKRAPGNRAALVRSLRAFVQMLAELRAKGTRTALVAVVLYARAIKLPLLPLLGHYFGLPYMLVLSLLLAVFAVVNGWLMERLTPRVEAD
jgi:hypothetical protein